MKTDTLVLIYQNGTGNLVPTAHDINIPEYDAGIIPYTLADSSGNPIDISITGRSLLINFISTSGVRLSSAATPTAAGAGYFQMATADAPSLGNGGTFDAEYEDTNDPIYTPAKVLKRSNYRIGIGVWTPDVVPRPLPTQPAIIPPSPGGVFPLGIPTLQRGLNMGVNAGVGPNLNNSGPFLVAGSNDIRGAINFNLDGNEAVGQVVMTWWFSAPRGPNGSVKIYPLDDTTAAFLFPPNRHLLENQLLRDADGNITGFQYATVETLTFSVDDMNVGVEFTDGAPFSITYPKPLQSYQQVNGKRDVAVTLQVTGTRTIEYSIFKQNLWKVFASNVTGTVTGTIRDVPRGFGALQFRDANLPGQVLSVAIGVRNHGILDGQSNNVGQCEPNYFVPQPGWALSSRYRLDGTYDVAQDPLAYNVGNVYTQPANDFSFQGAPLLAILQVLYPMSTIVQNEGITLCDVAQDSTSITDHLPSNDPLDTNTLFGQAIQRAIDMGGADFGWWWQRETDAVNGMSTDDYVAHFTTYANAWRTLLDNAFPGMNMGTNFKWYHVMIPKITTSGVQQPAIDAVNAASPILLSRGIIKGIFDFSPYVPDDGIVHTTTQTQALLFAGIAAPVFKAGQGY